MTDLSIVMYHYVRPIANSKFPNIKGLELSGFQRQLDYLEENFSILGLEQILGYLNKGNELPQNACWLTFDDGYKDHFEHVLPELKRRGIEGAFFPLADAVRKNEVLDVNAVHHILASVNDIRTLKIHLNELCLEASIGSEIIEKLWSQHCKPNRYDDADTIYVKRMLQHALPEEVRNEITKELFHQYVGIKLEDFSSTLYMSTSEVSTLVKEGMYVGSHGTRHYWLDKISPSEQRKDISESISFLEEVGAPTKDWVMCYPYGAHNNHTLNILHDLGAKIGVTTEVNRANLRSNNPLTLPRFDTNDFPQ